ncbi:MAG: peptidylprolyl isomerase [Pseudobdellovibrio sp.]
MKSLLFTVCFFVSTLSFSKELVDKIVASINSDVVLLSEMKSFPARIDKQGAIDETILLGDSLDDLKKNKDLQLNYLVREKILNSEIKRLGMGATDAQIDSELAQMAKRNHMDTTEFSGFLSSQGYTVDDYKKILKARIERQSFFEREIISKLRITDEDALGYYQTKNPNYRPSVGEFKIAQIFFSNKKGGQEQALARAQAAYERLKSGDSYETLANQLDETPGANPDGVLGTFKSGEFVPEIEKAITSVSEGQTTGIVQGPNGFHIVKVLSKKSVLDPDFLKAKEAIKSNLIQQNFERQLKNWFELKKQEANLKVYDNANK